MRTLQPVSAAILVFSLFSCVSPSKKETPPPETNACMAKNRDVASSCKVEFSAKGKMKIEDGHISVVEMKGKVLESPVVSPDGRTLIAISDMAGKAPTDIIVKDLGNNKDKGDKLDKPLMNLFIKGAFVGNKDKIVACELEWTLKALPLTVMNHFKTGEWDPIGYNPMISFYERGQRISTMTAKDFGLPKKTFLEHPRVSPDGNWMTFYVQPGTEMPDPSTQGIYLYNFATKKTTYLGNHADKHPTWSADGKQIFFHEQGKMGKNEVARIGYYNLEFSGNEVTVKSRNLFFDPNNPIGTNYVYQKHPAYHQGLRLVFFHARELEDDKKSIAVISMDHPEKGVVYLSLKYNDKKVKHAQHVDISDQPDSPLYFVGRVEGNDNDRVLSLDYAALQQIQSYFNSP
jgi:Tol biopolymer transport system component